MLPPDCLKKPRIFLCFYSGWEKPSRYKMVNRPQSATYVPGWQKGKGQRAKSVPAVSTPPFSGSFPEGLTVELPLTYHWHESKYMDFSIVIG